MSDSAQLHFLIVDKLEGVQRFARKLLEGYGFRPEQIVCVASPSEALQQVARQAPDFLLTDWFARQTPDGPSLCEQVRAQYPDCRIGLTSFEVDASHESRAQALGARFLLKKPFDAEALRATLQRSLEDIALRHPGLMARMAQQSGGRLDPRAGRRIELPPVALPPALKAGDAVKHDGKSRKVLAVVIRHGEQLAQLEGVAGFVAADKLSR
ncbi:CheY-like chemotaxis protein [Inhella inkyongensis]|uniref:CheY-like chemotaxis protein n=1 Tax=Inhella inkyongensis TaxID=392593 RepID=A0A840S7T6_9BURK|nr:response regulator [Inhella inkyongensis]MBB5205733.1 CheY-like chemotaxis protein [Inhella inkyongensis]